MYGCWSLFLIYIKRNNQIHFPRHLWTIETNNSRSGWDPNHHNHSMGCHLPFDKSSVQKEKSQDTVRRCSLDVTFWEHKCVLEFKLAKGNQHHIRSITHGPQYMGQKNLVKIWKMNDIYLFPREGELSKDWKNETLGTAQKQTHGLIYTVKTKTTNDKLLKISVRLGKLMEPCQNYQSCLDF